MNDPLAPIWPYLQDDTVTELLIDGWQKVYIEKGGLLVDIPDVFKNEGEVYDLIRSILGPYGWQVDESHPMADARMQDGDLINVVIPPISLNGPIVTLRKIARGHIDFDNLVEWKSIGPNMVQFLKACVLSRLNILVSGGTASGKTTFLNILAREIPDQERIIVCQRELFPLDKKRVVHLETRPANMEGRGEISMRQLVLNTARMRPDRIIVTEVQGAEVFDLCNLLNTGHDGSLFAIHAANTYDALSRLEIMSSYANPSIPLRALREQIASAIDLIIQQERMPDGRRRVIKISEITGMDDAVITTRDLFEFRRTSIIDGRIQGYFTATGAIPAYLEKLQQYGDVPVSLFTPTA